MPNVVYYRLHRGWQWIDYINASDYDLEMTLRELRDTPHDTIADFMEAPSVPANGTGISIAVNRLDRLLPLRGIIVVVTPTMLIRMLGRTMLQLYPRHSKGFFVIDTVDKAYDFIAEHRKARNTV